MTPDQPDIRVTCWCSVDVWRDCLPVNVLNDLLRRIEPERRGTVGRGNSLWTGGPTQTWLTY